eukprot:g14867.t1 g14867   contig21:45234-46478(+)
MSASTNHQFHERCNSRSRRILSFALIFAMTSLWNVERNLIPSTSSFLDTATHNLNHPTARRETLHVIQCLSGDSKGFIDEWEVNLKSVLMNAPLDSNLHVHILSDEKATDAVKTRFQSTIPLNGTMWRNEITVTVTTINATQQLQMKEKLAFLGSMGNKKWFDERIGMGGYFRLFVHEFIPEYITRDAKSELDAGLHRAVYMDTDVVVMTNLNHLMHSIDESYADFADKAKPDQVPTIPLMTYRENSGFLVMDIFQLEKLFQLARTCVGEGQLVAQNDIVMSDQSVIRYVDGKYPEMFDTLPDEWFMHVGHGYRRSPQNLHYENKRAAFLHFTGSNTGASFFSDQGLIKFCERGRGCNATDTAEGGHVDAFSRSWGMAEHYVKLSWTWALYQGGESRIKRGETGYKASVNFRSQ